jgi:hypothetical protein
MKKIFLDDLRSVDMSHNPNKGLGVVTDFVVVRNDDDFIKLVDKHFDEITLVSFDHDLACFRDGVEFTGKTACEYLIDKCLETGKKFPDWYVHSDNTSGRQNIIGLILNYMKSIDGVDTSGYKYFHRGFVNGKFV